MSNGYRTTIAEGLQRAARLIPFATRSASNLAGDYGGVCTPSATVPDALRLAQESRTLHYMATGVRNGPDDAPRYWVTSYGALIAWVTLDGRTHYPPVIPADACTSGRPNTSQERTMLAQQDVIRASWPERFAMDDMGDPITMREPGGRYVFAV